MRIKIPNSRLTRFTVGFAISTAVALVLGFLIPQEQKTQWFRASGYYFIFGTFGFWLLSLCMWSREKLKDPNLQSLIRRHGWAIALAALLTISGVLTSPPRFRVLSDETNLIGMSFAMYDQRSFMLPLGLFEEEHFQRHVTRWGKRPLFYPFLVSLAHTFFGYNGYNGFVVNAVAGFLCLVAFYLLLTRWFSRFHGILGMILLAAFPLFILWVTSSGFEIVNLLFGLLVFLIFDDFLKSKQSYHLELLGFTLVLLAQIRYESILFTLCIVPVVLAYMRKSQYNSLPYRCFLLPLTFLPIVWQRMTQLDPKVFFQLREGEPVFSAQYLFQNFASAWDFFRGTEGKYGMIPILTYLAIAGSAYGLFWLVKNRKTLSSRVRGLAFAGSLALILHGLVILSYYWGNLTKNHSIRFGITFIPFIVYFSVLILDWLIKRREFWKHYLLVGSVALLLFYWPVAGKNEAIHVRPSHRELRIALNFLTENYRNSNLLIISGRPGMYITQRLGAISFSWANKYPDWYLKELRRHRYKEIIVIQQIQYADNKTKAGAKLSPEYRLVTLFEARLTSRLFVRFSRVVI